MDLQCRFRDAQIMGNQFLRPAHRGELGHSRPIVISRRVRCSSTLQTWEWKNPGRLGCHLVARNRSEPAIKNSSSHDGNAMSASWRPSHSLAPAHARIGYLVNASLGARCRNRTIAVVAAMIADNGSAVVSHVAPQFSAVTQEIFRHYLLRVGVPMSNVLRVTGKAHQL